MSDDRRFTVLHPVAGMLPGDEATESQLDGCNVEALVQGGLLEPLDGVASKPPAQPPGPPTQEQ